MKKQKGKIEFRYYDIPIGQYILPLLGEGWEQEYGLGYHGMLHFHNYLEIGYCYHGHGEMIVQDRIYRYGGGMFTILPANMPHTTNSDPGNICKWEYLFIDMDGFVKNEMNNCAIVADDILKIVNKRGTMKTRENHPVVAELILNMIRECREKPLYYRDSVHGYLKAFVIELLRLEEEREQARKNIKLGSYMETALSYISEHYAEDIKVADIAEICGLSESHFRRIFDEVMNMKPVDYINLERIKNACEMLVKEELSMNEVGLRVGYQTPSSFNRNFKKITGMTPHTWKVETIKKEGDGLKQYNISAKRGWEAKEIKHELQDDCTST